MKMKKLLGVLAVAVLAAWTCQAADYDNGHVYNVRQFRVALGSGTAPTSADMAKIRLHNGDMVLNTDDNVLYIMNATNVYTKISAAGVLTAPTLTGLATNATFTVTKQTGAVTASGANNLLTITNVVGGVTNVYSFATNATVAVTVVGGGAVVTNATVTSP